MAYEIDWESSRGVYRRLLNHVTGEEILESLLTIESDPRFDSLRYVINDFLAVEDFDISEESVLMMSAIDNAASASNPNISIAIVATDIQIQTLGKLYATSPLNAYPTKVFLTISNARDWISSIAPETYFRKRPEPRTH